MILVILLNSCIHTEDIIEIKERECKEPKLTGVWSNPMTEEESSVLDMAKRTCLIKSNNKSCLVELRLRNGTFYRAICGAR